MTYEGYNNRLCFWLVKTGMHAYCCLVFIFFFFLFCFSCWTLIMWKLMQFVEKISIKIPFVNKRIKSNGKETASLGTRLRKRRRWTNYSHRMLSIWRRTKEDWKRQRTRKKKSLFIRIANVFRIHGNLKAWSSSCQSWCTVLIYEFKAFVSWMSDHWSLITFGELTTKANIKMEWSHGNETAKWLLKKEERREEKKKREKKSYRVTSAPNMTIVILKLMHNNRFNKEDGDRREREREA